MQRAFWASNLDVKVLIKHELTKLVESVEAPFSARQLQRSAHHALWTLVPGFLAWIAVRVRYSQVSHFHVTVARENPPIRLLVCSKMRNGVVVM